MKRVSILIILILIIGSSPLVTGKAVSRPTQRDVFLHQYFSQILVRLDYSLRYALLGNDYSIRLANQTLSDLEMIREESLYYKEKGVNSTVMGVIPPFYDLAKENLILVQLLLKFQKNSTPSLASGILGTVAEMEKTLNRIGELKLMNGTKVLTFNTTRVRAHLREIKKLASKKFSNKKGFVIGVSDIRPILNQSVTVFGSCPGNSSVTVVIEGGNSTYLLPINPHGGLFSVTYTFDELGTYRVYAVQGERRSNNVTVTVRRIPTSFIIGGVYTAFLNTTLHLSGKLVDYYGNPLAGKEITIGNTTLITGRHGDFSMDYSSPAPKILKVTLEFRGDKTHEGTSKVVTIKFTRYPVTIVLDGPDEVTLGDTATFVGKVNPSLPITVYVSGRKYLTLFPKNGTFSFELRPNATGEFKVYALFTGNEKYDKALSNEVVLTVLPPENRAIRYGAIALLALAIAGGFFLRERRREKITKRRTEGKLEPFKEETTEGAEFRIPEDIGEAYMLLREKLKETFGISESMTPREVMRTLKGWELYPHLERVILLHEKAIYGGSQLNEGELLEFKEAMESLLGGVSQ